MRLIKGGFMEESYNDSVLDQMIVSHEWNQNGRVFKNQSELEDYKNRMIEFFGDREEVVKYLEYWRKG
jgi:hypothetical protein